MGYFSVFLVILGHTLSVLAIGKWPVSFLPLAVVPIGVHPWGIASVMWPLHVTHNIQLSLLKISKFLCTEVIWWNVAVVCQNCFVSKAYFSLLVNGKLFFTTLSWMFFLWYSFLHLSHRQTDKTLQDLLSMNIGFSSYTIINNGSRMSKVIF